MRERESMEKMRSVEVEQANKATMVMESNMEARRSAFMMGQVSLRVLAIVSTVVAICVMVTATQTITVFSIRFTPHYSQSSAFR